MTSQTIGNEIVNSVSHGVGLVAAIVASPFLIVVAVERGGPAEIVGVSLFAATMILMYLTSTLYHALPYSRAKNVFRILDHSAIFLLIAGTYTPFCLGPLYGAWGWNLLALVWGLAVAGILVKFIFNIRYPAFSTLIYILMGWLILIAIKPLWENVSTWVLIWLTVGGIFYTVGVVFYAAKTVRYSHFVWHLFVLTGTVCHFIAVFGFTA